MRLQKSLPLFLVVAFTMALAIGCAPAQNTSETPAAESTEEMGHDDSMTMPDTTAMPDSAGGMSEMGHEGEGSGH